MSLHQRTLEHFRQSSEAQRQAEALIPQIVQAGELIAARLSVQQKILTCGNGGSASDAQHFAAELVNRFEIERPALPAIALNDNVASLTAIANDYHYNQVFAKQLAALGQRGDLLLAISTSGNSASILSAVAAAHRQGLDVIALTGRDGGLLADDLADNDIELRVNARSTARIQEVHILIIHCLCDLIDHILFGKEN